MEIYRRSIWSDTPTCFASAAALIAETFAARPVNVLVMGSGDGKHTIPFLQAGHHVTVVEDDSQMLYGTDLTFLDRPIRVNGLYSNLREEQIAVDRYEIHEMDYMKFASDMTFDVVFTSCSWQFRRNRAHAISVILNKFKVLTAPGGLIVADYFLPSEERHFAMEHYMTPQQLASHFDCDAWEILRNEDRGLLRERHIGWEAWHQHRYGAFVAKKLAATPQRPAEAGMSSVSL
jgi:hypothetical protein